NRATDRDRRGMKPFFAVNGRGRDQQSEYQARGGTHRTERSGCCICLSGISGILAETECE
ncbi:MAG TPA: hypothetical protein VK281_11425, partial [Xanthobacteraceae bacterium]|nr:hypothetical protein [Xanthobacteraceae bacterium]